MKKLGISWLLLICCQLAWAAGGSSVVPQNLRCEYLVDPRGIDELQPRLSWTLRATDTTALAQRQTAYNILVDGTESDLRSGRGTI